MKKLFVPCKINKHLDKSKISQLKKIQKNLSIFYSIQYEDIAKDIKKNLSDSHNILNFSQVLGCSKPSISEKTEVILLISSGKFHGISLAYETKKPVFIFDNYNLKKISKKEIENFEAKKKTSYLNYLNSEKIGILISTKPGQNRIKKALELKDKIKDKEVYFFIANNLNFNELENFSKIDSWINTACPRLDLDSSKVINLKDLF